MRLTRRGFLMAAVAGVAAAVTGCSRGSDERPHDSLVGVEAEGSAPEASTDDLGARDEVAEDGAIHDGYRIDYLRRHVAAMRDAVDDGVDLIGYTWWGPIDIVSAGTGEFAKRYGFVYVDKHDDGTGTLERRRKDSFYAYQRIIKSNGADLL